MGGIRAPQAPYEVKRSVQELAEKTIIKEIPCPKQGAEIVDLKDKLAKEGQVSLKLRERVGIAEDKASRLDRDCIRLQSLLSMAEKRISEAKKPVEKVKMAEFEGKIIIKEIEKPVLNKKMLIFYTLAALAIGLGIGVIL